jgi:glutaredoxin
VKTITLIGKPGCHLCDDARAALVRLRGEAVFTLEEVDITRDDELHRRYLERIPVVEIDGEEAFELFVDATELRRRLARVGRP